VTLTFVLDGVSYISLSFINTTHIQISSILRLSVRLSRKPLVQL